MRLNYLIRTNSLDADDRFEKTLSFLCGLSIDVSVFAVVKKMSHPQPNRHQAVLWLRKAFTSGRCIAFKYIELLVRSFIYISFHRGKYWFANFDFLPLHFVYVFCCSRVHAPIWDLHEMPPSTYSKNPVLRFCMRAILKRSHVIVCNHARREALAQAFDVNLDDCLVLRNFPSANTAASIHEARKTHLSQTPETRKTFTVVIVGGNLPGRYVGESVSVIEKMRSHQGCDIRVLIVGGPPYDPSADFVESTGPIPFETLAKRCVEGDVSLCFYSLNSPNNLLCEPNRFFQALSAGQFVVTFDHPSLADIEYPRHHVINEETFAAELSATLGALHTQTWDSATWLEQAKHEHAGKFHFENQESDFRDWIEGIIQSTGKEH